MHVLPLPFGLALAVLPRRDADLIRTPKRERIVVRRGPSSRERVLSDIRYADSRQHLI
jgi:hypothetical protein